MANQLISTIVLPNNTSCDICDREARSRIDALEKIGLKFLGITTTELSEGETANPIQIKDGVCYFSVIVDIEKFESKAGKSESSYEFVYSKPEGSAGVWKHEDDEVTLSDWGLTIIGEAYDGEKFTVKYHPATTEPAQPAYTEVTTVGSGTKTVMAKSGNFTIYKKPIHYSGTWEKDGEEVDMSDWGIEVDPTSLLEVNNSLSLVYAPAGEGREATLEQTAKTGSFSYTKDVTAFAAMAGSQGGTYTFTVTAVDVSTVGKEFIFDGTRWWEMGSTGSIGEMAYADSASGSVTAAGNVTAPTVTVSNISGTEIAAFSTMSAEYVPASETLKFSTTGKKLTASAPTFTGTAVSVTVRPDTASAE